MQVAKLTVKRSNNTLFAAIGETVILFNTNPFYEIGVSTRAIFDALESQDASGYFADIQTHIVNKTLNLAASANARKRGSRSEVHSVTVLNDLSVLKKIQNWADCIVVYDDNTSLHTSDLKQTHHLSILQLLQYCENLGKTSKIVAIAKERSYCVYELYVLPRQRTIKKAIRHLELAKKAIESLANIIPIP